jgi:hypothetical protein
MSNPDLEAADPRQWRALFRRLDVAGVTQRIDELELLRLTDGLRRRGFTPDEAIRRALPLLRSWRLRSHILPAAVLWCVLAAATLSGALLGDSSWRAFAVGATAVGTYAVLLWRAQRRLLRLAGLTLQELNAS